MVSSSGSAPQLLELFSERFALHAARPPASDERSAIERIVAALEDEPEAVESAAEYAAQFQLDLAALAAELEQPMLVLTRTLPHGKALVGTTAVAHGQIEQANDNIALAERHFRWACDTFQSVQEREAESFALTLRGRALQTMDQLKQAEQCYLWVLAIDREVGNRLHEGVDLDLLGEVAHAQGRLDDADQLLRAALIVHRQVHDRQHAASTLFALGQLARDRRKPWRAKAYFVRSRLAGGRASDPDD
jgi:tetratricopeptide (TPR) repeat protein